jgi:hypothetical protein
VYALKFYFSRSHFFRGRFYVLYFIHIKYFTANQQQQQLKQLKQLQRQRQEMGVGESTENSNVGAVACRLDM